MRYDKTMRQNNVRGGSLHPAIYPQFSTKLLHGDRYYNFNEQKNEIKARKVTDK